MILRPFAAAALLFAALPPVPLYAQAVSQEEVEARYDRALAAGYKALFLCSAIANAEANGTSRTPESVMEWELTGIQEPLSEIAPDLLYDIERLEDGAIDYVAVTWARDMTPRIADHREGGGCSLLPPGMEPTQAGGRAIGEPPRLAPIVMPEGVMADVVDQAFGDGYGEGARTTAVLVRQNDAFVAEAYADDFGPTVPQRTWSVAKSIAATLVGAAVHRGEADVTRSAGLGESDSDPRRVITIDHLLRMASGRYSDTLGNRTDPLYFGGSTVEETALHWPLLEAPGSVYRYANNDTLAAVMAIDATFDDHPPAQFFDRLGMTSTVAETDWQGDYILSSQVWSTARDLSLLGQLYLDDGVLPTGVRILPEGWADYVSAPSGPQPDRPFGYGAGFWLFNDSEGVPPDTFAAMGNRGQYVVIVPSRDVVIVRRGEDPVGSRFDIGAFTRDVLAALDD
ncbi:serine hydrolase [Altererythrobacter aurantiacus]|uniref:Serine hydrolase n=1 Tax=Parapontixanthobacter aurantiacus TaxID=1463599 RepID=A0A844ZF42_9SPHN|nr:serine hydrolase [Parapontixanthobacter aurantiacus]MXO85590.1 serine hydrolase [Parapontixanthobacter aurantiacus]